MNGGKIKLRMITKNSAVNSAVQFLIKLISRLIVIRDTTRQRGSSSILDYPHLIQLLVYVDLLNFGHEFFFQKF